MLLSLEVKELHRYRYNPTKRRQRYRTFGFACQVKSGHCSHPCMRSTPLKTVGYICAARRRYAIDCVVEHLKVCMDLPFYEDASDPSSKNSTRREPPMAVARPAAINC